MGLTNPLIPASPSDSFDDLSTLSLSLASPLSLTSDQIDIVPTCILPSPNFTTSTSSVVRFLASPPSLANSENGSQTSLHSQISAQSLVSIQSQISFQSQISIVSQGSLQSELSLLSQSSLGFLPSLESFTSDHGNVKDGKVECRCLATFKGESNGHIFSLALSGDHLYCGSTSKNIRVLCKENLSEHCNFGSGDHGGVKAVMVAGESVFSAHQDHRIRAWRRSKQQPTAAHKLIATLPTVKDYLMTFIPPKNYVQIRRHQKRLWIEHVDTISVLVAGSNGLLYSGSWDRTVKVWRLSDFKCLESFKAHDDAINALVVSDDGFLYTGSADAKIRVWAKQVGEKKHSLVRTLESHKSAVNALALSPDGSILYSGACDRAIAVWEREDSAQHIVVAGALRGHRHAVLCLASAADTLCSGSADKTIRVWRKEAGRSHSCLAVLRGHTGPVKCLAVAMNNCRTDRMNFSVYSGSLDEDIKVWSVISSTGKLNDEVTLSQKDEPLQTQNGKLRP